MTTTTEAEAERRGMERAVAMLREMAAFSAQFDNDIDRAASGALDTAADMIAATAARRSAR